MASFETLSYVCPDVFFGGKRVAMRSVSSGNIYYYEEDMLGSSRTMVQAGQTSVCYDADFYPFGGERDVTRTDPPGSPCRGPGGPFWTQNYKFEGKERDTETGNDDFGARYYTSRLGRWLSADWSGVPAPVPYANLTNPQTLNLYAMVSDNPETFADLDGHDGDCSIGPGGGISCKSNPTTTNAPATPGEGQNTNTGTGTGTSTSQQAQQTSQQNQGQQQATQTQQKQLSADDVSKAIQSAKEDKGPGAKTAVDFLNSLGTNWKVSGDTLSQALKDSKVNAHGADKKVDSISRTGNDVTVQLKGSVNYLFFKAKQTVSFRVGSVSGRPALVNIQGVEKLSGLKYKPYTQYGPN